MTNLIGLLVALFILGIAFYCIVWLIGWIGVPEPFNKVIKAVVGIAFIIYLLALLTGSAPYPVHFRL